MFDRHAESLMVSILDYEELNPFSLIFNSEYRTVHELRKTIALKLLQEEDRFKNNVLLRDLAKEISYQKKFVPLYEKFMINKSVRINSKTSIQERRINNQSLLKKPTSFLSGNIPELKNYGNYSNLSTMNYKKANSEMFDSNKELSVFNSILNKRSENKSLTVNLEKISNINGFPTGNRFDTATAVIDLTQKKSNNRWNSSVKKRLNTSTLSDSDNEVKTKIESSRFQNVLFPKIINNGKNEGLAAEIPAIIPNHRIRSTSKIRKFIADNESKEIVFNKSKTIKESEQKVKASNLNQSKQSEENRNKSISTKNRLDITSNDNILNNLILSKNKNLVLKAGYFKVDSSKFTTNKEINSKFNIDENNKIRRSTSKTIHKHPYSDNLNKLTLSSSKPHTPFLVNPVKEDPKKSYRSRSKKV